MRELTEQDPRVLAGFRLLARLGEGGMGRVYLAVDRRGERVAVKVVHPEYATDDEFRRRFRRETRLAARVAGPGLARVVAADPDAESPWLATEYVPGLALSEAIGAYGAFDTEGRITALRSAAHPDRLHAATDGTACDITTR
ncbi:hypothetical protein ACIRFH_10310 [Streptomyces sp. NPDC093586]|uniref:protein kinase domain-containing protein n=1 Tax=Streptomyces sp. NPDC093586 TaxID=3366042 RepID=UPI00380EC68D